MVRGSDLAATMRVRRAPGSVATGRGGELLAQMVCCVCVASNGAAQQRDGSAAVQHRSKNMVDIRSILHASAAADRRPGNLGEVAGERRSGEAEASASALLL